jgi:acyl-CoA reductase-like NAD-dependent aldehyde dehydrogenase
MICHVNNNTAHQCERSTYRLLVRVLHSTNLSIHINMFLRVNVDLAMAGTHIGLFALSGQTCTAASRIYVHEIIYAEFVKRAVAAASDLKLRSEVDSAFSQGPLIDDIQHKKVLKYIQTGIAEGAKLLLGGQAGGEQGYYVQPTVFADVDDDMIIAKEEIFGAYIYIHCV